MGKKVICDCGNQITFEGEVPSRYACGMCGKHLKIDRDQAQSVDLDHQPVIRMRRRRRPGAVE